MPQNPKVSVILTSYNHAKHLHEAIDSVLVQTFSDFELIIWDDASTDSSWGIINSYSDSRIRAFHNENNQHGGNVRRAIEQAVRGRYIAVHHSDDIWEPQKLEKQVAFLDTHPEIGAVFSWAQIIDENGQPFTDETHFYYKIFEQPNRIRYEWLNFFFYHGNALCHPSVLIRKQCYDDVGVYRYGFAQTTDFDMWVRLCLKYEIHVLPEKLVRFRVRAEEANTSGNRPETRVRSYFEFLQLLNNYREISSFEELKKIFPFAEKYEREGGEDIGFVLGMVALEEGTQHFFHLFGLTLLFEALNDFGRAKKILDQYNFSHRDFIELTAKHDVFSVEIIRNHSNQLAERDAQVRALNEQVGALNEQVGALNEQVGALNEQVRALNEQLHEIMVSKAWRVAMILRRARLLLLPPGSRRTRMVKKFLPLLTFPIRIRRNYIINRDMRLIQNSGYFDREWYLAQTPGVSQAGMTPLQHYLQYGGFEGRDPGPYFSSQWYLSAHPNVRVARINPLLHYLKFGQQEGRHANQQDSHLRRTQNPESKETFPSILKAVRKTFHENGGVKGVASKIWMIIRRRGIRYLLRRVHYRLGYRNPVLPHIIVVGPRPVDAEYLRILKFRVVPYYLDPYKTIAANSPSTQSVAVHLHLFQMDALEECVFYLQNIPVAFDLFISSTETINVEQLDQSLCMQLPQMGKLVIRKTPNCGLNIAPFIIEFGQELLNYNFVAHIHNQNSPSHRSMDNKFYEIMETLFGSPASVHQIFQLLQSDAKFVYPVPSRRVLMDESGWGENYPLAKELSENLLKEDIEQYPIVEFPQDSMFWATSTALSKFLQFPLKYTDFSIETISPDDNTITFALERLFLISAQSNGGRNYRLYSPDSTIKELYYENQNDYSEKVVHTTVRVLSYYLPQFYSIPENDLWHGEGFTEWNKVRSATPFFYGHYQQRVPHEDIGYYSLINTEILKKQSRLMKQAGVYGQVFYHYWFNGKLILEKPSQMLLEDKSIDMPFCFCWANENWTRKWDGNEDEILLGQTYSEKDAKEFITYLIPFFKDKRYITIDGHPVLFIYRPSSIPDFSLYQRIWQRICAQHNLPAPYVVAILTRGAKSPNDFGMDAGCERVLHDWTDGNVRDIKDTLYPYWKVNGSVLDYNEVADYYMNQPANKDFTYFRSVIPSWDNTPRYGSEAYIVHNSTPKKFQEWLEYLVFDAEKRLPEDRRFVLVNAWNEWAESAVLDPDKRFGYSYLNAIGRALSGINFHDREYVCQPIPANLQLAITFSNRLLELLQENKEQERKLLSCLAQSTVFSLCNVSLRQSNVLQWLEETYNQPLATVAQNEKSDYTLYLNELCYFAPDTLESMLKMALRYDVGVVIPSSVNDENFTHANLLERWETTEFSTSKLPPIYLEKNGTKRSIKCCVDASIYITHPEHASDDTPDVVSTIIRIHQSSDLKLLQNALYSLLAQNNCIVQPMIAVQDLPDVMQKQLEAMLHAMPWNSAHLPIIKKYCSDEQYQDLRSLMLNDMLKMAQTNFVAFLDYDDVLFPKAYNWLIQRLKMTGKNASFGLIYTAIFNLSEQKKLQRQIVFDHGKSFADFIDNNHSPLHGFMLDVSKINLANIEFHKSMKYMEDYFLTLQIFTENDTDWESLTYRQFIGDYYHYEDKAQTLAISDHERRAVLKNADYIACQEKIDAMRRRVLASGAFEK